MFMHLFYNFYFKNLLLVKNPTKFRARLNAFQASVYLSSTRNVPGLTGKCKKQFNCT